MRYLFFFPAVLLLIAFLFSSGCAPVGKVIDYSSCDFALEKCAGTCQSCVEPACTACLEKCSVDYAACSGKREMTGKIA